MQRQVVLIITLALIVSITFTGIASAGEIKEKIDFLKKNTNWLSCYKIHRLDCSNLAATFVNTMVGNQPYNIIRGRMRGTNVWHAVVVIKNVHGETIIDTTTLEILSNFNLFDLMVRYDHLEMAQEYEPKEYIPAIITYKGKTGKLVLSPSHKTGEELR